MNEVTDEMCSVIMLISLMPLVTLHRDQVLVSMKACAVAHPNLFSAFWMSFAQSPWPPSSGTIVGLKPPGSAQELLPSQMVTEKPN